VTAVGVSAGTRDVHGNGILNGTRNRMGMGIKHRIGNGNGKPSQWEWELPALPWEFIPKGFMLRKAVTQT